MSAVTLAVSSGCHVAAAAAFESTLFGSATPRRCFKTLGELRRGGKDENKGLLLGKNLWLTGANTGGCVIFWSGRGVQSRGFWVMGLAEATGDLEELFTHDFIIGPAVPGTRANSLAYTFALAGGKASVLARRLAEEQAEGSTLGPSGKVNVPACGEGDLGHTNEATRAEFQFPPQ